MGHSSAREICYYFSDELVSNVNHRVDTQTSYARYLALNSLLFRITGHVMKMKIQKQWTVFIAVFPESALYICVRTHSHLCTCAEQNTQKCELFCAPRQRMCTF